VTGNQLYAVIQQGQDDDRLADFRDGIVTTKNTKGTKISLTGYQFSGIID
jgi:hypothetical protein